jgi:branched-chain amino acid transport system permease protein
VLAALAGLMLLFFLERSAFGKILAAIRNNDNLVQTLGINVHLIKVCCVGVASALAGLAGALQAHANNVISPGDFSFLVAAFALAYLKIGGESHIMGSVLGATLLTLLAQFAMRFGPYEHIFYGAAIVIAVLLMPGGLIGVFEHFRARNHASGRAHARVGA